MKKLITIILLFKFLLAAEQNLDPSQVLTEAGELARAGKFKEALEKHIWYHNNALKIQPSQYGKRLSFALMDWTALALQYPPALEELRKIRYSLKDKLTKKITNDELHEYLSLNEALSDELDTLAFVNQIGKDHPELKRHMDSIYTAVIKFDNFSSVNEVLMNEDAAIDLIFSYHRQLSRTLKEKYSEKGLREYLINDFIMNSNKLLHRYAGSEKYDLYKVTKQAAFDLLHILEVKVSDEMFVTFPGKDSKVEPFQYPEPQSKMEYAIPQVIGVSKGEPKRVLKTSLKLYFDKPTKIDEDDFNFISIEETIQERIALSINEFTYSELSKKEGRSKLLKMILRKIKEEDSTKHLSIKDGEFTALIFND